jgi:DNA-binding CsgD family transcriptional regulator
VHHRSTTSRRELPADADPGIPACRAHPGSPIRRYRTHGPRGPGVYPQCLPADGGEPHLLEWGAPARSARPALLVPLSPGEVDVLVDAAGGMTVKESAVFRARGTETVKTQRKSVLTKLGSRNITQAVAVALRDRLISAPA